MFPDPDCCTTNLISQVLQAEGRLDRWHRNASRKGTGFQQPLLPHEHWHIDLSYVKVAGTFYYLCAILDGCSRLLIHWALRERIPTADVETVLQRAREQYPEARPRIIADNRPPFVARDFTDFIRLAGMNHVRTAPYYPQSNGKLERWYQTLKVTTLRPRPLARATRPGAWWRSLSSTTMTVGSTAPSAS